MSRRHFAASIRFPELFVLLGELSLGCAGVAMIVSSIQQQTWGLYLPVRALLGMLPAILAVGFAGWLVYRMRCLEQARSRFWGLVGATCLSVVAISFGAAIGKMNAVLLAPEHTQFVGTILSNPEVRQAGLASMLTFSAVGFIFGMTFFYRVGRKRPRPAALETVASCLYGLSERIVSNWSEHMVNRIDQLIASDLPSAAVDVYETETGCSHAEALRVIADWPEERLRLEAEALLNALPQPAQSLRSRS